MTNSPIEGSETVVPLILKEEWESFPKASRDRVFGAREILETACEECARPGYCLESGKAKHQMAGAIYTLILCRDCSMKRVGYKRFMILDDEHMESALKITEHLDQGWKDPAGPIPVWAEAVLKGELAIKEPISRQDILQFLCQFVTRGMEHANKVTLETEGRVPPEITEMVETYYSLVSEGKYAEALNGLSSIVREAEALMKEMKK